MKTMVMSLLLAGVTAHAASGALEDCKVAVTNFADLKWPSAAKADAKFKAAVRELQAGVAKDNASGDAQTVIQYSPADVQYTAPTSFSSIFEPASNVVRPANLNATDREPVQIAWNNHDYSYIRLQIDTELNPEIDLRAILLGKRSLPSHRFSVIGHLIETKNSSTKIISNTVGAAHFVCGE